jgi:hypothetical protein
MGWGVCVCGGSGAADARFEKKRAHPEPPPGLRTCGTARYVRMAEAWLRRVGSATAVAHDLLNHQVRVVMNRLPLPPCPPPAHSDALQVCARCVLRLLNVREPDAYRVVPPPRRTLLDGLVSAETAETAGPSGEGEDGTADDASPAPCVACLGVLSLFDGEDNSLSVAAIVAGLREAGHVPQRYMHMQPCDPPHVTRLIPPACVSNPNPAEPAWAGCAWRCCCPSAWRFANGRCAATLRARGRPPLLMARRCVTCCAGWWRAR